MPCGVVSSTFNVSVLGKCLPDSMKILFLSRWFPYPPNNGSKVRIFNLLRALSREHQITLLSFNDQPDKSPDVDGVNPYCDEVITIPWKSYKPDSIKALLGFFSLKPRFILDTFSTEMAGNIQKILKKNTFDLIIASQIEMASYYKYFNGQSAIFDEIEIGVPLERYARATSFARQIRQGLTWFKHKKFLTWLLKSYDICTVTSAQEHYMLLENGIRGEKIIVIPNCVDLVDYQDYAGTEKTNTIIFAGSFRYQPNYEAMVWFLEKVFPDILDAVPEIQLIITGDHMNLPLPQVKNVTKTGFVDNIRSLIGKSAVSVVPMRTGGGTRLKILESMALRTAVISTSKGAEGLEITHQQNIILADEPSDFAEAVVGLVQDTQLQQSVAKQGFHLVEEKYSLETLTERYQVVLDLAKRLNS